MAACGIASCFRAMVSGRILIHSTVSAIVFNKLERMVPKSSAPNPIRIDRTIAGAAQDVQEPSVPAPSLADA